MFYITQLGRGYKFQQIFGGDVKQIPKNGHLPTPVICGFLQTGNLKSHPSPNFEKHSDEWAI